MKLQDWFQHQAQGKPSDMQKMRIYQQFLDKSHRSISFHKISYYTKVAVFSIGLFVLGGTIYYSGQPIGTSPYSMTQKDGYATLQERPGQFVQADTIGQIISAEGVISITHNNTQIETDTLSSNDRVLLAKGSEMYFRIDEHIHAKIIGPAEFVLEDAGSQEGVKKYVINLISGDYLEVITIPNNTVKDEEEEENELPVAQVTVKAADFSIEQVDTRGTMDLVISTTVDGKKQVKNNGTEIVMKKIVAEKQTYVAIQQDETVSVNGYVEFVANDKTPQEVLAELEETKFTVRYEVRDTTETATVSDVLRTSETLNKKVASETLITYLNLSLNSNALQRYIIQMNAHASDGDIAGFSIAYTNYLQKIARGFELGALSVTLPDADPSTIYIASRLTQKLADELAATWYIDPSLLQGLRSTAVSLANVSLVFPEETVISTSAVAIIETLVSSDVLDVNETEESSKTENISGESEQQTSIEVEQKDTLEGILHGVVDPLKPIE